MAPFYSTIRERPGWMPTPCLFNTPRFPPEILSAIFIFVVDRHIDETRTLPEPTQRHPKDPTELVANRTAVPQSLTRVCRSWRNIALGLPGLWARFGIADDTLERAFLMDPLAHMAAKCSFKLFKIQDWLALSRAARLTVVMQRHKYWNATEGGPLLAETSQSIYRMLCNHSSQWFDMHLLWSCAKSPHLDMSPLPLPRLFRLSCHFNVGLIDPDDYPPLSRPQMYSGNNLDFMNAPNLREVMLNSFTIGLIDFKLPWSQPCSLAFQGRNKIQEDGLYVADCLYVLSQCVNLVDLKIYDDDKQNPNRYHYSSETRCAKEIQVVSLPLLRHLICATGDSRIDHGVIPRLHLPALESLRLWIRNLDTLDDTMLPIIAARPPLRMLQIDNAFDLFWDVWDDPQNRASHNSAILRAVEAFPDLVSYSTNSLSAHKDLCLQYHPTSGKLVSDIVPGLQELCLSIGYILNEDKWFLCDLHNFLSSRRSRRDLAQKKRC